jgi:hypothetical protein
MFVNSVPRALRPHLRSLVLFSGVCFCITVILNLAPLLNGRKAPLYISALLVPASWIVTIPAAWIIWSRLHSSKSLAYWKAFWPGTPLWMTYALLLILAFTIYIWRVAVFGESMAPRQGFDFAGAAPMFWVDMFFFGAAFRVLYSARKECDADTSFTNSA